MKKHASYSSPYFYRYNANPWGMNIGDCAVRAVSVGLNMPYQEVCRRYGVSWKKGHGLIRDTGIELEKIKNIFSGYFDLVQDVENLRDFNANNQMLKDLMKDPDFDKSLFDLDMDEEETYGDVRDRMTLNEFMEQYRGQGSYLVGTHVKENPMDGHIVCAFCNHKPEPIFVDSYDSSAFVVDCIMRIRKRLARNSVK